MRLLPDDFEITVEAGIGCAAIAVIGLWVVGLGVLGVLAWVAWHFIAKVW
jgi:hypothetical protein